MHEISEFLDDLRIARHFWLSNGNSFRCNSVGEGNSDNTSLLESNLVFVVSYPIEIIHVIEIIGS